MIDRREKETCHARRGIDTIMEMTSVCWYWYHGITLLFVRQTLLRQDEHGVGIEGAAGWRGAIVYCVTSIIDEFGDIDEGENGDVSTFIVHALVGTPSLRVGDGDTIRHHAASAAWRLIPMPVRFGYWRHCEEVAKYLPVMAALATSHYGR